ncbi:hypothetical protein PV04_04341 [Phialophora macrospora]|uniref:Uncharacterized protein n=1 Tax=Phialophora macrospora TaxID=1851006 RepID=A0A0D2FP89_9EURO|nr:hypothetical protein PV04_04341 [Phialophora macrospora]
MEPILRILMAEEPLSLTPQRAFDHADNLLQQATALREKADALQEQADFMYGRADTLTNTAEGLQEIAHQDRDAMQVMWDKILLTSKEDFELYVSDSGHATRFNEMVERVEDGLVNVDQMNRFLGDFLDFVGNENYRRSAAPEPESPTDCEQVAERLLEPEANCKPTLKRRISTANEDDEAAPSPPSRELKRMRYNEESGSTSDRETTLGPVPDVPAKRTGCDSEALANAEEKSEIDSASTADKESDGQRAESETSDSSDEEENKSSVSIDTHTTAAACDSVDETSSAADSDSESESSASNSTSASPSSADSINSIVVQGGKGRTERTGQNASHGASNTVASAIAQNHEKPKTGALNRRKRGGMKHQP